MQSVSIGAILMTLLVLALALRPLWKTAVPAANTSGSSSDFSATGRRWLLLALTVLITAIAWASYASLDSSDKVQRTQDNAWLVPDDAADPAMAAAVTSLSQRLKPGTGKADEWALLARSQVMLGRYREALPSFAQALAQRANDPDLLADYADAMGMSQSGQLAGEPAQLIERALAADPLHRKSLALAGTRALQQRDLPAAIGFWERLRVQLTPGSDDEKQVLASLSELSKAVATGAPPQPSPAQTQQAKPRSAPSASAQSLAGLVRLEASLRAGLRPGDVLFVVARAADAERGGSRVPLAVWRGKLDPAGTAFELTDAMGMLPDHKLSAHAEVTVQARVSRTASATPAPGDLQAAPVLVRRGAQDIELLINRTLP